MKKLTISLIAIALLFSACSKDKEVATSKKSTSVSKPTPKNKVRESITKDEIISTIQAFQQSRSAYIKQGTYTNYTQDQAMFQMSLVLNYEKGLYGYYSDIENTEFEIEIANNGTNNNNETLLNGGSMFSKYIEIQEYINNQIGSKNLSFLDISLEETTQDITKFRVSVYSGTRSMTVPSSNLVDFPILPIDVPPVCSVGGNYDVVADAMTAAWRSVNYSHFKPAGYIYAFLYTNSAQPYPFSYDNYGPGAYEYIFHSSSPTVVGGAGGPNPNGYNMKYYNHVNDIRLALPSNYYANSVRIQHQQIIYSPGTGSWSNYCYTHRIEVDIWSKTSIPGLFESNLPIIM